MATAERVTTIHNPARKGHGRMTAKQIRFFGTKRQRAALKAKRHHSAAKKHRARSKPAKRRHNRAKPRTAHRKKSHRARTNPGAIYALVNPAKGHRKMAAKKHRRKASKRHNPFAGKKRSRVHHRRRNAGAFGRPMDWLSLSGGVVIGGVGATSLPQIILGSSNTGLMGYIATIAATGLLAFAARFLVKGNTPLIFGVIGGGGGALIRRIIQDYSLPGQALLNQGVGDIITDWNFTVPQRVAGGANPTALAPGGYAPAMPVNMQGAGVKTGVSGYLY